MDRITVLHVGKAGGGTVQNALNSARIKYIHCHPYPWTSGVRRKSNNQGRTASDKDSQEQLDMVIATIRDPVDRFVSAFNFRNQVLKDPRWKEETHTKSGDALSEQEVLTSWYGENVSRLAQAFCADHNSEEWKKALMASESIRHLRNRLDEWLGNFFVETPSSYSISSSSAPASTNPYKSTLPQLIFVVQERIANESAFSDFNRDFAETADRAVQYILTRYYNTTSKTTTEGNKHDHLLYSEQDLMPPYWRIYDAIDVGSWLHSSKKKANPPPPLSKLGECCLTRFLSKQYQLLQSVIIGDSSATKNANDSEDDLLLGRWKPELIPSSVNFALDMRLVRACHWGTERDKLVCQAGLRNIVKRRLRFLINTTTPCDHLIESRGGTVERNSS